MKATLQQTAEQLEEARRLLRMVPVDDRAHSRAIRRFLKGATDQEWLDVPLVGAHGATQGEKK
jgi:hypothetical protein